MQRIPAIIFTFFFRAAKSSGVIGFLVFAWCRLTFRDSRSLRTGKNNRTPNIKDVTPYQIVIIGLPQKTWDPELRARQPDVTESHDNRKDLVKVYQYQAWL